MATISRGIVLFHVWPKSGLGIEKNGVRPKLGELLFLEAKVEVIDSLMHASNLFQD